VSEFPVVASALHAGTLTTFGLAMNGGNVCTSINNGEQGGLSGQSIYNDGVSQEMTDFGPGMSGPEAEAFESLAIEDVCPSLASAIPAGDPGS
jgi:hypothetical protein